MRKVQIPPHILKTIGVARSGNVFILGYNKDYVETLTPDQMMEVLKHEVLHLCFYHLTMWDDAGITVSDQIKRMRNIAEDLEVNCYLDDNIVKQLHGQRVQDYDFPPRLGAREYFKRLAIDNQSQTQQNKNPNTPCNGGKGGKHQQPQQQDNQTQSNNTQGQGNGQGNQDNGQSPTIDDHSKWPTDIQDSLDTIEQSINDLMVFAAEEVEKSCGEVPDELKIRVDKIRRKPRPVTDWRRYFRRFCGNEFSELIRKSKKRVSKRFPDAAGNRHQRKSHILVGIDTSGSVSMPEYKEFMGQIKTLSEKATFHVIECDACIQYEYDYKGKCNETLHGGGGTAFEPVINVFNKNKRKYDALVYFTDGYCSIPKNTPKNTLWVISSKGDHDRNKYKVNGATSVFIPEPKSENR